MHRNVIWQLQLSDGHIRGLLACMQVLFYLWLLGWVWHVLSFILSSFSLLAIHARSKSLACG